MRFGDGQGGQFGGAAAAQTAVARCIDLALGYSVKQLLDRLTWREILGAADEAVSDNAEAGFTTLIGLCVAQGKVCGASCGDSAALLVSDNQHTVLTERQRKNSPVGSGEAFPAAFTADFVDSTLLVMSDGVWRYIGDEAIAQLCTTRQRQELVFSLRQMQMQQNGGKLPDDFSIIVV